MILKRFKDINHQMYFINTLKWPFLSLSEKYFEFFSEFILRYIQHSFGKIRQAIVSAADYLTMGITIELETFSSIKAL